jgi:hypothetical protein
MAVIPPRQGNGVGRALLDAVRGYCGDKKVNILSFLAEKPVNKKSAYYFYEKYLAERELRYEKKERTFRDKSGRADEFVVFTVFLGDDVPVADENGTLREEVSTRPERSVYTPETDIDGERKATLNITNDILPELHPDDLVALREFIAAIPRGEADTRSRWIELKHPVTKINGKMIDPIEFLDIKGGMLNTKERIYPHMGTGAVPRRILADKKGKIHHCEAIPAPEGGSRLSTVINEYNIHYEVNHDTRFDGQGLLFRYPVGWGMFKDVSYNGEELGYLILGISRGLRGSEEGEIVNDDYNAEVGRVLRKVHDRGYTGLYFHGGNMLISTKDGSKTGLWDFEGTTSLSLEVMSQSEYTANVLIDLYYAMKKAVYFGVRSGLGRDVGAGEVLAEGYFAKELAAGEISAREIAEICAIVESAVTDGDDAEGDQDRIKRLIIKSAEKNGLRLDPDPAEGELYDIPGDDVSRFTYSDICYALRKYERYVVNNTPLGLLPSLQRLATCIIPLLPEDKCGQLKKMLRRFPDHRVEAYLDDEFKDGCRDVAKLLEGAQLSRQETSILVKILIMQGRECYLDNYTRVIRDYLGRFKYVNEAIRKWKKKKSHHRQDRSASANGKSVEQLLYTAREDDGMLLALLSREGFVARAEDRGSFNELVALGVCVSAGDNRYRFSELMRGPDLSHTRTMINAVMPVVGSGEKLATGNWQRATKETLRESVKMAVVHELNNMISRTVAPTKTVWHVIDKGLVAVGQESYFQNFNAELERAGSSERVRFVRDDEELADVVNGLEAEHPGEEISVAAHDRKDIDGLASAGVKKILVFEGEPGDIAHIDGIIAALRALYLNPDEAVPMLKLIYTALGAVPGEDVESDEAVLKDLLAGSPYEFAAKFVYILPKVVGLPVGDLQRLNRVMREFVVKA